MKLSLAIATFNEEKNIHIPFESTIDLVDEVVVVDGGSVDKTIQIAQTYGEKVRIIKTSNPLVFHENKQKAIEAAKGEWILQLDADESLSDELKKEIITLKPHLTYQSQIAGYWIPRKNWFLTRYLMKGGVYPDPVLRLYKKQGTHFSLQDVHDNVSVEGKTEWLTNAINHHADPTFERYIERWNRYTTFDAHCLFKEKKQVTVLSGLDYFLVKPTYWFFKTYFRHKGFMDGFPGFVFSLFSSIRYWAIYVKAWKMSIESKL